MKGAEKIYVSGTKFFTFLAIESDNDAMVVRSLQLQ